MFKITKQLEEMKMKTIEQFCEVHDACDEGKEWAINNCKDMNEAWNTIKPEWLIWIATREGVLTDKELRLFAVFSARQVQHLMEDERSINAIDVAERFANDEATAEELKEAQEAQEAAWDAAWAARDAWDAAWAARDARDAAWAAWAARAARSAAWAARDARDASEQKQADWLKENVKPVFE